MPRFAKLSALSAVAIACLSFSAIGASAASAASPAAYPGPVPISGPCIEVGSGSPGYETFTLNVDEDSCGYAVQAAAECVISVPSGDPGGTPPSVTETWVYGPTAHAGGTSKTASCGLFNIYFLTYGFRVYYGGAWRYTQIGDE
jgi:hypothetical protein